MTETTTDTGRIQTEIHAATNMGGSARITRHCNGHVGCSVSNGLAASLHYAGILTGRSAA